MNRKNYLFFVVLLLFSSCNGLLDVEPEDSTSPEGFISDRQTASNVLSSVYVTARRAIAGKGAWLAYTDLRSGQLKMNNATGIHIGKQNLFASTNDLERFRNWNYFLEAVQQCNLLIENIDKASYYLGEEEINSYKGQAYFIRGLMDFYMTQIWGDCPLLNSTNAGASIRRTPMAEVLESIVKDATTAIELLPLQHTDNEGNIDSERSVRYANKAAAIILLVKAHVSTGNYTEAVTWYESLKLINRSRDYDLEIGSELADIYKGKSKENVFGFNIDGDDYSVSVYNRFAYDVFFSGQDQALIQMVSAQYVNDLYEPEDMRLKKLFEIDGEEVEILKNSNSYLAIFRISDLELLAAEAYFKLSMEEKALAIINKLKIRNAIPELFDLTGDSLWNEIMIESEREFIAEGKLFFEWNRWGVLAENVTGITTEQIVSGIALWPIAEECFKSNAQIVQNPYWLND